MINCDFLNQMAKTKLSDREFFQNAAKRVIEWNFVARGKHEFDAATVAFQKKLVKEEFDELVEDGIKGLNKVLVVDAVCDIFVVGVYWSVLETLKEVSDNLRIEGLRFAIQDVNNAIDPSLMKYDDMTLYVKMMEEGLEKDNPYRVLEGCIGLMLGLDFDYRKALTEVLDSNDSKIPTIAQFHDSVGYDLTLDDNIQIESVKIENRNFGRYTGVSGKVIDGRIVFKDGNGKIMKPCTFQEARLEGFV